MRKTVFPLLCTLTFLLTTGISQAVDTPPSDPSKPPVISAKSAILVDAVTGETIYEKNPRAKMPPASTTKMMTAILVLENSDLDCTACASEKASETPFGGLHLKPGEQITVRHLLYGLLLRSSNDAAVCVAEHIGGTEEKFADMMNEKAAKLGAKDTHFVNPHGLYDPAHISTAYDLSLIARYAIKKPVFNEIVKTKTFRIERSMNDKDVYLKNTARFLWKFNGADGIKTGYTKEAGRCFVGSATRDNWRLISVVLHADDAGADTAAIMDYGFRNFKPVTFARYHKPIRTAKVRGGVKKEIVLIASKDLSLIIPKAEKANTRTVIDYKERISAPIEKGEKFGTLTGYRNGKKIGQVDLVAAETVERTLLATIWLVIRTLLLTAVGLFVVLCVYGTAVAKNSRRRRRSVPARSRKANYRRPSSGKR